MPSRTVPPGIGRDFIALQRLMGHSRPDTTQAYTDDLDLDDLADAFAPAAENRYAQASSELDTESDEAPEGLESLLWRRRESNPRPTSCRRHKNSRHHADSEIAAGTCIAANVGRSASEMGVSR